MEKKHQILDTLNESLKLEYSLIIHYPLINRAIKDPDIKQMVNILGVVSIKHADTVADAITALGGTPQWDFEPAPDEIDLKKIFYPQLEKEKLALKLHSAARTWSSTNRGAPGSRPWQSRRSNISNWSKISSN